MIPPLLMVTSENLYALRNAYTNFIQQKLHYFLADDTVEVVEELTQNSGRDPFPVFIKRQKPPNEFAALSNLRIGSTVDIWNRTFLMYAAS
jgi:hypothetical protein